MNQPVTQTATSLMGPEPNCFELNNVIGFGSRSNLRQPSWKGN